MLEAKPLYFACCIIGGRCFHQLKPAGLEYYLSCSLMQIENGKLSCPRVMVDGSTGWDFILSNEGVALVGRTEKQKELS